MKKVLTLGSFLVLCAALISSSALAGDGKALFTKKFCVNCHGADGHSKTPQYPHLAGQNKEYLVNQFNAIIFGKRELGSSALMKNHPKLKDFSPAEIEDIATFLSGLKRVATPGQVADVAKGEAMFKNMGCPECHGAGGKGMPLGSDPKFAAYPRLNGQHGDYLFWQMKRILEGKRTNNHALTMRDKFKAEKLTDKELRSLASYLSTIE